MKRLILIFLLIAVLAIPGVIYLTPLKKYIVGDQGVIKKTGRKLYNLFNIPLIGTPDLKKLEERLRQKNLRLGSPIFMRIFKKESLLELWIKKDTKFVLFATYPICTWSGYLGPKLKRGDYQAPEGFYTVTKGQLNPKSRFHRSFNLGYPNVFDKAHKRTGDYLMVHGNCVSAGCYAMTDPVITELWLFVTKAFNNGQKRFHVHAFPFRMTEINLALNNNNRWHPFWQDLKPGYDIFEKDRVPPKVTVCNKRYIVRPGRTGNIGNTALVKNCKTSAANNL